MAVSFELFFTNFGISVFQQITPSICAEFMHESIVFCSACTMSSLRKFTFAISSPDEFLVKRADRKQLAIA